MTSETASDLAYADTLWKSADALRGQVDAAEYKRIKVRRKNDEGRSRAGRPPFSVPFFIPPFYFLLPTSDFAKVQSEKFVAAHGDKRDDISIYGQESNPTTW